MTPSAHCEAFIKGFEGLRTKAYPDTGGKPTLGYGHTAGVKLGDIITEAEALKVFKSDLAAVGRAIDRRAARDGIRLNQNEFDALCAFAFNLGEGNLFGSKLWCKLKAGDRIGAANEFLEWNHGKDRKGNLIVIDGLTRRRRAERALFLS